MRCGYIVIEKDSGYYVPSDERGNYYNPKVYLDKQAAAKALLELFNFTKKRMLEQFPYQDDPRAKLYDHLDNDSERPNFEVYNDYETFEASVERFEIVE